MNITAEELKALLSTPIALLLIMIGSSLGSAWKQMLVARRSGTPISVGEYFIENWPETVAMLGTNVVAWLGLVFSDSLNPGYALGAGYVANDAADLFTGKGRSNALGSDRQGGFARVYVLAFVTVVCIAIATLSGCVTTAGGSKELTPAGRVALQESAAIATRRYVREHDNAAARIANIREVAIKLQSVTSAATVKDLRALAEVEINQRISDPYDKLDAISLLNVFEVVLREQLGDGALLPDQMVRVNEFLVMLVAALPPVPPAQ